MRVLHNAVNLQRACREREGEGGGGGGVVHAHYFVLAGPTPGYASMLLGR